MPSLECHLAFANKRECERTSALYDGALHQQSLQLSLPCDHLCVFDCITLSPVDPCLLQSFSPKRLILGVAIHH
jgi:hypothetical protein